MEFVATVGKYNTVGVMHYCAFFLFDHNIVNAETFVLRRLRETRPHTHRQRPVPIARQRPYAARHRVPLISPDALAADFFAIFPESLAPAHLAVQRNVREMVIPEV